MNKINLQSGLVLNTVVLIIAVVVVIAGIVYFIYESPVTDTEGDSLSDEVMDDGDKMGDSMAQLSADEIFAKAPSITLKDVSDSGATGEAWLGYYAGKSYHRVELQNVPPLGGTDFYEGWLVKNPATGAFFSTGKMDYNPATKIAILNYITDGDKTDHSFVVITSEPDDGDPKPDKHIIEERFPEGTNFVIGN